MNIFLITPLSPDYKDIDEAVMQSLSETENRITKVDRISHANSVTQDMLDQIKYSDLIIADISDKNPNVMYQVGFAQSLGKPILPISRKGEPLPFDIASVRILIYERSRLFETLIKPLRNFLAHNNLEAFIQKEIKLHNEEKETKRTVFVSYSHADLQYLDRLKIHLRLFEKQGKIDLWSDTKIKAGEKWKEVIEKALSKAVIAILLISADFLASDFIIDNELPPLLKSAQEEGIVILPVILRPCRFSSFLDLSIFQAINDPKSPLSKMNENEREEIYVKIADYIESLLK